MAEACFLESSASLCWMEGELLKAVMIIASVTRQKDDLAPVAAVLQVEFGVGPKDMYIRS